MQMASFHPTRVLKAVQPVPWIVVPNTASLGRQGPPRAPARNMSHPAQATVHAAQPATSRDGSASASTSARSAPSLSRMAHLTPPTPIHPGTLRLDQLDLFHNGVLLVDKPDKWTSFDVCGKIRNMLRFYGVKKVGHAGTLDPMATGLLIVCTGKGTKWADEFQAQSKVYSGTIRLGEATPSYDAESEVCERQPWEHITDAQIDAAAAAYVGDIMQLPPMFSAIKVQGQKLYELAREGQKIEVQPRPITINALRVWRQAPTDQELHFHVACSKGTYVRSMAHDLGLALGSVAHITALRREASGDHKADAAWRMQDLIAELNRVRDEHRAAQDRGAEASAEGPAAAAAEAAAATTAAAAAL